MSRKDGTEALPGNLPASPHCPFCDGAETELFNAFGSQLSVATYWCRTCRTAFEFMKWGGGGAGRTEGASAP